MDPINDGLRAKYIVEEDYDNANTIHSRLKPGYFCTNESLEYISKFDIKDKNVLTVCGSGDHAFMSLINGASHVDTFDYNPLQYYLLCLKCAAIKALTKEEYLKYFPISGGNILENYNIKYYERIREYLEDDARVFWDIVYQAERHRIYLLSKFSYNIRFESNYTRQYDLLKERLFENPIDFKLSDLFSLPNIIDKKCALIMFSNIYDHLSLRDDNYKEEDYYKFIIDNILSMLEDDGSVVFHYQFGFMRNIKQSNFPECDTIKCSGKDSVKVLRNKM